MKRKRVIVMDVVGLSPDHFESGAEIPHLRGLFENGRLYRTRTVFPALTLPVQASVTTGLAPAAHGVVANGFYFPEQYQVAFWEQASSLVRGERVWERLKAKDPSIKTALLFFQNSLYASSDVVITPKPLHTEEGLVQWCYSKPVGLYESLCQEIGAFELMHYWGPLASIESSRWIARAAVQVLDRERPDLMFVYLPHLDYCSQKMGPEVPEILDELALVDEAVGIVVEGVRDLGLYEETVFVVFSEYTFSEVRGDVSLNRVLRDEGFLRVREINGREYLDLELSPAFAMVDHQVAHVYTKPGMEAPVRRLLEDTPGVDRVMDRKEQAVEGVDHPRSGDLVAVSARDRWFSYPWWHDADREPDFARHIDIHRKPGYDPLELFFEEGTLEISRDTDLIHGSHGYPPCEARDDTVLLVSGDVNSAPGPGGEVRITDMAGMIQGLCLGETPA
ncbi:MAG: alkaline phosphatase family protein [Deltaproteobacteria bacterium]|nr:alkaline phosphatase family protein [Deltaproteobacteria bacterium]